MDDGIGCQVEECRRKLERVEAAHGRNNNLRREFNRAMLAAGSGSKQEKALADLSRSLDEAWAPTFCSADYTSGDGFQTATWGPSAWLYLHITSLNYRPERKDAYKTLLEGFKGTLPCVHCRNNFAKNMRSAKKALREKHGIRNVWKSRETFARLIWQLHHEVNVMLGKCIRDEPTFEQMRDELENFRSRCLTPEEIEKERQRKKGGGCVDSPYGADAKSRLILTFVPREDDDLKRVSSYRIAPQCRVRKR